MLNYQKNAGYVMTSPSIYRQSATE